MYLLYSLKNYNLYTDDSVTGCISTHKYSVSNSNVRYKIGYKMNVRWNYIDMLTACIHVGLL